MMNEDTYYETIKEYEEEIRELRKEYDILNEENVSLKTQIDTLLSSNGDLNLRNLELMNKLNKSIGRNNTISILFVILHLPLPVISNFLPILLFFSISVT